MHLALDEARLALLAGEPPVGACIVADGQVVAKASNAVITELDVTAHAEIRAIRDACAEQRALSLANCHIYATVEPCAMCLGACHYAGISTIVFGATLKDMHRVTGNELVLAVPPRTGGDSRVTVVGDFLREQCVALLEEWSLMRQGSIAN